MDAALQIVIESVVDDKVRSGDMFTAFDVSLEVKKRGHRERHNNMKQVVHSYYEHGSMGPDYSRTLVTIPGAPVPAWLYYRNGDDPATYQTHAKANPQAVQAQVAGFYAQGQASAPDDDDDTASPVPSALRQPAPAGTRRPDARGSICVPAWRLRLAGFKPKDRAYVYPENGSLIVSRQPGNPPMVGYTVDENNNVRITRHVLNSVGTTASGYDFDGDTSKVVVKPK